MDAIKPQTIAFIDLGTNSVRMSIIKLNQNGSFSVLTQQKEVIRLGEGEFTDNRLTIEAASRAIEVITRFINLAKSRGTEEFIAVATSAAREASNGEEFCARIEEISGVRINIISGTEEARLIWLGVSSGVDMRDEKALFIDIGGGSTEIIVGDQNEPYFLRSLKLGSIRTTANQISPEKDGRISLESLRTVRRHIRHEIIHITKYIRKAGISRAYGSSGTIISLESVAGKYKPLENKHIPGFLSTYELDMIISYLSRLPLQLRREVQGLNPDRADIIIAGALILDEILKAADQKGIWISSRSLRDGLLIDYISRIPGFPHSEKIPVRLRSVRQLGKTCHIDEKHAHHIVALCNQLFQSGKKSGLIKYSDKEEELLSHAAYLHDVGQFISFSNHHQHSYYLITEIPLLGFNQHEILLIALITRYHRKKIPKVRDVPFQDLNRGERRMIRVLSLLLRFAEILDKSHDHRIQKVLMIRKNNQVILQVFSKSDCSLELWAVESEKEAFYRTFRVPLLVEQIHHAPVA